ncbi:acetyl-CoA C-acyltransferase [Blastomonas sp. UPD001]|uniref:acetyl-CoA C-acyltransferase n=1 Tax=Blastomonas sp. UPD001 TaxID=2217673 RepID=UPI000E347536|nr:acetyl-CoA C-acyltransferase [Blastomonas sp. UPD001]
MHAYIVSALRSAGGRRDGRLRHWHAADLAGAILDATVDRLKIDPALIDDVIIGCAMQAGEQASNIGRNAVLSSSKLPDSVPGTTVDRQCGSGQQALHFASQAVMSGTMDIVVAGGVEMMTRVPMGAPRRAPTQGNMFPDASIGIRARYPDAVFSQFAAADRIARKFQLGREQLDAFALASHQRAAAAALRGDFDDEIIPVHGTDKEGHAIVHAFDEGVRSNSSAEGLAALKPLDENGLITAGTSSQICDGAAALLVTNERGLARLGLNPLARIDHISVYAENAVTMLEAPIEGTRRALARAGRAASQIDLYEVNEAFASIPLAWMQELEIASNKVNANGGAIALGHPLGASGIRITTTLVHALKKRGVRYGLQTMCEAGGLANTCIIEAL